MTDSDTPTTYNNLVQFIEQNDTGVVAQELDEKYVPVEELEALVNQWRVTANYLQGPRGDIAKARAYKACADGLEALIND